MAEANHMIEELLRTEHLREIERGSRPYSHESKAMAKELRERRDAMRAAMPNADIPTTAIVDCVLDNCKFGYGSLHRWVIINSTINGKRYDGVHIFTGSELEI